MYDEEHPEDATISPAWMYIPVLGPWLAMTGIHDACGTRQSIFYGDYYYSCTGHKGTAQGLAVLGAMQLVGAGLAGAGLVFPSKRLVRSDVAFVAVPMGHGGYGVTMSGRL